MRESNFHSGYADGGNCGSCGASLRWAERLGGGSLCFDCRYGVELPYIPVDKFTCTDCNAELTREYVTEHQCLLCWRCFPKCVECGERALRESFNGSLACPSCVEKLGTDEQTGRWDGKPEPSEDAKKVVA